MTLSASDELPRFSRPYDWESIDHAVRTLGGVIVVGLLPPADLDTLDDQIDDYLDGHADDPSPVSGSEIYDLFLGQKTVRLHGLVEKIPSSADLIARPELVDWAERLVGPMATSVLLNAGELIQIEPGEPAQFPHRDTDSWPEAPIGDHPVLVNAIVALDAFTLENGATYIAPESWQWDLTRQPAAHEFTRALMDRGDAVLFRGDLVHGGGENGGNRRRRALSISYCAAWLRPVENSFLNVSRATARSLPPRLQGILGYAAHDATSRGGGLIGLFENGDPKRALDVNPNG